MNVLDRLVQALRGKEIPVADQEDKQTVEQQPAAAAQDDDARAAVDAAARSALEAQRAAAESRDRFWREVEHADRVSGSRR